VADVRVLLAGWFSFDELIATVGDELGADVVAGWLTDLGIDHDVAWASHMERGVDWRDVNPAACTHLVFVSGPLADRPLLRELSEVFAGAQRWAVDVSVVEQSAQGLFDRVWERDAPGLARPDLASRGRSRRCRWSRWRSRRCRGSTGSAARPSGSAARSRSGWPTARCPGSSWTGRSSSPPRSSPPRLDAALERGLSGELAEPVRAAGELGGQRPGPRLVRGAARRLSPRRPGDIADLARLRAVPVRDRRSRRPRRTVDRAAHAG
jgi:hypothetical protein